MSAHDLYSRRGVSATKEDVHEAVKALDKGLYPNAFCKIVPDFLAGDKQYCNIMHADGAGTKSALAYIYWKETGDLSVWEGIAQDAVVMNLDDMLCVGADGPFLVSSTIGRHKARIPGEIVKALIHGTQHFIDRMHDHGVNMVMTGGETADLGDLVQTVVVDSVVTARMPRSKVISNEAFSEKDVIVGLSSYGQTTWEDSYNGGMGSNGLTSARHDVFSHEYAGKYPESYDPSLDSSLVYGGSCLLTDPVEGSPLNAGKLVLSPTRTYAPVISRILHEMRGHIHGMVHCSGGGQTKILHFLRNLHAVKNNMLPVPPLFRLIARESGASPKEMYRTFNMGHRMELFVHEEVAREIISLCQGYQLKADIIGYFEKSDRSRLSIITSEGSWSWT